MAKGERSLVPPVEVRTYYDRPVLKEPTWRWYIPAYFWAGGMAAGSSMLAAGADVIHDGGLARRSRVTALGAITVGSACLVADLGRPGRLHHMLRVAKLTSPMSVGTWLLAAYGPAAGLAATTDVLGILPGLRRAATWTAAAVAPLVASYTAVLLSDTAIPAWHDAHATMPGLFVTSAASAAGGAALVGAAFVDTEPPPAAIRLAVGGALAEGVAALVVQRNLDRTVRAAYESGPPRRWARAASALGLAGACLTLVGIRRPRRRLLTGIGGAMVAVASGCERFAVVEAGKASARDPAATVTPQRARLPAR